MQGQPSLDPKVLVERITTNLQSFLRLNHRPIVKFQLDVNFEKELGSKKNFFNPARPPAAGRKQERKSQHM